MIKWSWNKIGRKAQLATANQKRYSQMIPWLFPCQKYKRVVITTAQLHSAKSELGFGVSLNPARGVSAIRGLSWVNQTTKTIYHHSSSNCSIFSRDIDDQRMMKYDWTGSTTGHNQPKMVVSDATYLLWLSPRKKFKRLIELSRDIDDQRIDWLRIY